MISEVKLIMFFIEFKAIYKYLPLKYIIGPLILLSLSMIAFSQNAQVTLEDKVPLKLELSINEENSCETNSLILKSKLKNISQKEVIIDKRNLWRLVYFKGAPDEKIKVTKSESILDNINLSRFKIAMGDNLEGIEVPIEYSLSLKPGEFYEEEKTISFEDVFFSIPGKYEVKTAYKQNNDWTSNGLVLFIGAVESNTLEFNIPKCKQK